MDNGPIHDSVFADKKTASDSENGVAGSAHKDSGGQHNGHPIPDDAIESSILKKLDRRIIPMCCWIYLMNFMDRGVYNCIALTCTTPDACPN